MSAIKPPEGDFEAESSVLAGQAAVALVKSLLEQIMHQAEVSMVSLSKQFQTLSGEAQKQADNVRQVVETAQFVDSVEGKHSFSEALHAIEGIVKTDLSDGSLGAEVAPRIGALLGSLKQHERIFNDALESSAQGSEAIAQAMASTITDMQFQDRVNQLAQNAGHVLDVLSPVLAQLPRADAKAFAIEVVQSMSMFEHKHALAQLMVGAGVLVSVDEAGLSDAAPDDDDVDLF